MVVPKKKFSISSRLSGSEESDIVIDQVRTVKQRFGSQFLWVFSGLMITACGGGGGSGKPIVIGETQTPGETVDQPPTRTSQNSDSSQMTDSLSPDPKSAKSAPADSQQPQDATSHAKQVENTEPPRTTTISETEESQNSDASQMTAPPPEPKPIKSTTTDSQQRKSTTSQGEQTEAEDEAREVFINEVFTPDYFKRPFSFEKSDQLKPKFRGYEDSKILGSDDNTFRGGNDPYHGFNDVSHAFIVKNLGRIYPKEDDDVVYGMGGDDKLYGRGGEDILFGGTDNDVLFGGWGDDRLSGGAGDDEIYGGSGYDIIHGGSGDDAFVVHSTVRPFRDDTSILTEVRDFSSGTDSGDEFYDKTTKGGNDIIRIYAEGNIAPGTVFSSLPLIRLHTGNEESAEELLAAANFRLTQDSDYDGGERDSANDPNLFDTIIYHTQGTPDQSDDIVFMVLQDFSSELTLEHFNIVIVDIP